MRCGERAVAPRGLTLTEIIVAMLIVAGLAAIVTPAVQGAIRSSQEAACLSNLRQIGAALKIYASDHNQRLPEMAAGRHSKEEDVPVLDTVLEQYIGDGDVFRCPADDGEFERSGSSYLWNATQSGKRWNNLGFMGIDRDLSRIPLVSDKEAWHGEEKKSGTNFLYADLSASDRFEFSVD